MSTIRRMSALEERHARLLGEWFRARTAGDAATLARLDREIAQIEARLGQENADDDQPTG